MEETPKIVLLPRPNPVEASASLIETLETLMELALAGEIESFAVAAVNRDGSIVRAHAIKDDASKFALVGVLAHECRYISQKIDAMNLTTTDHLGDGA